MTTKTLELLERMIVIHIGHSQATDMNLHKHTLKELENIRSQLTEEEKPANLLATAFKEVGIDVEFVDATPKQEEKPEDHDCNHGIDILCICKCHERPTTCGIGCGEVMVDGKCPSKCGRCKTPEMIKKLWDKQTPEKDTESTQETLETRFAIKFINNRIEDGEEHDIPPYPSLRDNRIIDFIKAEITTARQESYKRGYDRAKHDTRRIVLQELAPIEHVETAEALNTIRRLSLDNR